MRMLGKILISSLQEREGRQPVQNGNEAEGKRHQLCAEEWAGLTRDSEWEQEVVVEKRVTRTLEGAESQLRQHRSRAENWALFSSSFSLLSLQPLLHFPSPCHQVSPHSLSFILMT